jgi:hypothetical protein
MSGGCLMGVRHRTRQAARPSGGGARPVPAAGAAGAESETRAPAPGGRDAGGATGTLDATP